MWHYMIIKQGVNQMLNSFEDLTARFTEIASQPHVVSRKSHGAVGELFEELMVGEVVGNQSGADFAEIACRLHKRESIVAQTLLFVVAQHLHRR